MATLARVLDPAWNSVHKTATNMSLLHTVETLDETMRTVLSEV